MPNDILVKFKQRIESEEGSLNCDITGWTAYEILKEVLQETKE